MTRNVRLGLTVGLLTALPAAAAVQSPSFPAKVELITVDVVVVDKNGKPVLGLTQGDFALLEDQKPQEIVSFEAFSDTAAVPKAATTSPAEAGPETRAHESGPSSGPQSHTVRDSAFLLLVDDLHISPETDVFARRAVSTFLERSVRDGDEIILVTSSRSVGWRGRLPEAREPLLQTLPRIHGHDSRRDEPQPMTDYQAYESVRKGSIDHTQYDQAFETNSVRAREIDALRRTRMDRILGLLRMAFDAWSDRRGRKSVLFLSEGFIRDDGDELRRMTAAAQQANAAVYFIDVRGLVPPRQSSAGDDHRADLPLDERQWDAAGSRDLAEETGGFSFRNNGLTEGLERVAAESRAFYLLGFYPPDGKRAKSWRKLRVEVRRRGLTVRARSGYRLGAKDEAASAVAR